LLKLVYQTPLDVTTVTQYGGNGQGGQGGGGGVITDGSGGTDDLRRGVVSPDGNTIGATAVGILVNGTGNTVSEQCGSITIHGNNNTIMPGVSNVVLINSDSLVITESNVLYIDGIKVTVGEGKRQRKYESFPRFLDMDYYYYHELEKAKNSREGMIVAKSRRKGFSYKGAFNLVYEYNWYRDSFSIISAFMSDYSQSTMNMALDMINFLNKHTDWAKRKLIDTRVHIKAGFKEKNEKGIEVEHGYKSEIMTMSFKDNPFKSIGKSSSVMLFEEAGKWPGLIEAYMLSKPLFSDGDVMIGIPIIYGTGGDMEGGTQDFASMFYSPEAYGLRSYENIWDENAVGECGWFVDDAWYKLPHVDDDGNSDRVKALSELDLQRDLVRKSGNKRAYQTFITQHPIEVLFRIWIIMYKLF